MILKIEIAQNGQHKITSDTPIEPKNLAMLLNNLVVGMIYDQINLKVDRDILTPNETNGSGGRIHSI